MMTFHLPQKLFFLSGLTSLICLLNSGARAEVRLAGIYGEHMVLQQGLPLTIQGSADPGERVTVKIANQSLSRVADGQGQWKVPLTPLRPSSSPVEFTVSGKNTVVLQDVLVGDVWLCCGQVNLSFPLYKEENAAEELPRATNSALRFCTLSTHALRHPASDRSLKWSACSPQEVRRFSAVGYYFGREVHQATGVPVGLLCAAVGSCGPQCWASLDTLKSDPAFEEYLALYRGNLLKPGPTNAPKDAVAGTPASLFNGMIAPLMALGLKGVLWYQGESNTKEASQYQKLFPALVTDWRRQWGQPHLPFVFVQLPPNGHREPQPQAASAWAAFRDIQAQTLWVPETAMAVTIDLGRPHTVTQPPNKRELAHRLAEAARSLAYQEPVDYAGPVLLSARAEGNKMRVRFRNAACGLSAGTPYPRDAAQVVATAGVGLKGFCIAGADRKFVRAQALIDGNTVLVSSDKVPVPAAVEYAWEDNPEANLYNKKGLPAAPFQSQ